MLEIKIQRLKEYLDKKGGVLCKLKRQMGDIWRKHHKKIWYNTQILEKYKAIYFKGFKVASSSLTYAFYESCFNKPMKESIEATKFKKLTGRNTKRYTNYFKFTFVRNPWDRLVSAYKMISWYPDFKKYNGTTFKKFAEEICNIPDENIDQHLKSQHIFIFEGDKQLVDYIGRFENLEKEYLKICKIIKMEPVKLLHKNKGKIEDYSKYYDEGLKELVRKRYAKDIKLFNYKFKNHKKL